MALAGSPALTGCGANLQNALTDGPVACTRAIAGQVHSGVFPIQSATVRLAQTVASSSSGCGSTATTLGLATTDTDGNFSFSQTYTCSAASQFAYITVTGGHSLWRGADTERGTLIEIIGLGAPLLAAAQLRESGVDAELTGTIRAKLGGLWVAAAFSTT